MEKILLTGFEPYGHTPHNPAESVARALDGKTGRDFEIVSRIAPSSFFDCIRFVQDQISEINPAVVVMLGEYGGRSMITVERLAQNLNDATRYGLEDNQGCAPQDEMTVPDGPVGYYSTLPIRAMVKAMREGGIPADISDAAGTLCCNHLMYGILHYIQVNQLPIRAGWIHLPPLPEVAALPENLGLPSMSVETSARGVEIALRAIVENREDIEEPILSRWQI
ncbi:MAG: pyroglutamyl-peptidase I [Verrucomicrobiota bacterium]